METPGPSPNMKVQVEVLALRITPNPEVPCDKNRVIDYVGTLSKRFIVSQETSKKNKIHFHTIIENTIPIEDFRKGYLKAFPDCTGHYNRYNLSLVEDYSKAVSYCVKDKDYYQTGYTEEELSPFIKKAFKKYSKQEFQEKINELDNKMLTTDMNQVQYITQFNMIKSEYKQNINWQYAIGRSESLLIKKNGLDYAEKMVKQKLSHN